MLGTVYVARVATLLSRTQQVTEEARVRLEDWYRQIGQQGFLVQSGEETARFGDILDESFAESFGSEDSLVVVASVGFRFLDPHVDGTTREIEAAYARQLTQRGRDRRGPRPCS